MNMMKSKRTNCDSTPHATIMNAINGTKYDISADEEVIIGRSLSCTILVEEIYISRHHCFIRYENNQFVIFDNNTSSGTYLNNEKLNGIITLKHGDLIGFGDKRKLNYVFKFCLSSNSEERPKLDKNTSESTFVDSEVIKTYHDVLNLKVDQLILKNRLKYKFDDFQNMQKEVSKIVEKLKTETMKFECVMQELNRKVSECEKTIQVQQNCLDVYDAQQSSSLESFKTQIHSILENNFECPICNEVMVKAYIANCGHTYCKICIKKWIFKSKICPVCRSSVENINKCFAMDNFITNYYEIIGGPIKEQRDNLQEERRIPAPQTAKRGRISTHYVRRRADRQIALDHFHPEFQENDDIE